MATMWPQPTRDQVGHPFEWYALHFALSCIGPLIDPGTRTQEDDTNNNEAPRTSAQPMAPTRPHNPFDKDDVPEHLRDDQRINGATQPSRDEEAATRPARSHTAPAQRLRRAHSLRAR